MADYDNNLVSLLSWFSPVFPTGSFAYSAGLEQAVADGLVFDEETLQAWLDFLLRHGGPKNDSIFIALSKRQWSDSVTLAEYAQLCLGLAASRERYDEIHDQGRSFLIAVRHWFDTALPANEMPLPVAIGAAAGRARLNTKKTILAYIHAFVSGQLQAAIRLSVTGQDGSARLLAKFDSDLQRFCDVAASATLDDLGSCAFMADIAMMNHETLQPKLFLS
jgi:urease accessory protein